MCRFSRFSAKILGVWKELNHEACMQKASYKKHRKSNSQPQWK